MATTTYEDHGVRFEYPSEWTLEVTEDGPLTTIDLQHPDGVAFVLVSTDLSCPDPGEVADSVLETMREEYPDLEADPTEEVVNERLVSGYDVQFFSLDLSNTARIRCFRTFIARSWSSGNGRISSMPRSRISPRRSFARSKRPRIDRSLKRLIIASQHRRHAPAACSRTRRDLLEQRLAAHVDDIDMFGAGDLEPVRGRTETHRRDGELPASGRSGRPSRG